MNIFFNFSEVNLKTPTVSIWKQSLEYLISKRSNQKAYFFFKYSNSDYLKHITQFIYNNHMPDAFKSRFKCTYSTFSIAQIIRYIYHLFFLSSSLDQKAFIDD